MRGNNFYKYLNDKNTSAFCAVLNAVFAINAALNGSWLWFALCSIFACYCYRNYILAHNR